MAVSGEIERVKVWDLPTRLFHWALVAAFAGAWYTAEEGMMEWHERCGLAIIALLVFRLIWGFVGGEHARFSGFVKSPVSALRYVRETLSGRHPDYLGHNPLGGWSVLVLLAALAVQATLGLFGNDDILFEGPLYPLVSHELSGKLTGWHHLFFDAVLILAVIHVTAVVAYLLLLQSNLIWPMVTGWKKVPAGMTPQDVARTPLWIAAVLFAGCAIGAWALTLVN